ncbi:MAG: aminotransferase class I/II-fold pyridoxal phosphate-dependent enzyme [Phycisphaerales bacterium]|nr:aminotransferase class I/II-fold pyridoxal phosphate-dependent enzyme [Phycisphaerales bacterium]
MSPLSNLAETLIGSEIVRLGNAINERKAKGEQIYNYTIGDFDPSIFPIPIEYEEAIIKAYQAHRTNYPPADGLLVLRNTIADLFRRVEQIDYKNDEVLIASGGRPLIYSLFKAIVDKGDKVIYTVPSWNNNHYVHMNDGEHCIVDVFPEHNFMPRASDIAPHIQGAILLCLCSPQNPTGTTLEKKELEAICDLIIAENATRGANEKKLYLMFDQMYWSLTFGAVQHYNPVALRPEMKAYTIFVDGVSKSLAATGVRVGWSMGPAYVITKMKALLSHIGAWSPMAEQYATAEFLNNQQALNSFTASFKKKLEERLNYIYQAFIALKEKGYPVDMISPQAAIYLTLKIDFKGYKFKGIELTSQADVSEYLLNEAHLAIVPFSCFGADKESPWYRMSIGTCKYEELDEMFAHLESSFAQLEPIN